MCSHIKRAEEKACSVNYRFALKKGTRIEDDCPSNNEGLLQCLLRNLQEGEQASNNDGFEMDC
jgi:hypothetical protein